MNHSQAPGDPPNIEVEVAYALPERQAIVVVTVPAGATIADAIAASGMAGQFPELEVSDEMVGVFGRRRSLSHPLRAGDRVEIYRPLQADPKEIRRQRARLQKDRG